MGDQCVLGFLGTPWDFSGVKFCADSTEVFWMTRDHKPMSPVCIGMQKDHTRTLKILQSTSEFGGLWKHPNNPACTNTNSVTVFVLIVCWTTWSWTEEESETSMHDNCVFTLLLYYNVQKQTQVLVLPVSEHTANQERKKNKKRNSTERWRRTSYLTRWSRGSPPNAHCLHARIWRRTQLAVHWRRVSASRPISGCVMFCRRCGFIKTAL